MCETQPGYRAFTKMLEGPGDPSSPEPDLHGGGHFLVGGGWGHMSDIYNSPGDPLFYLHHATLDRGYWIWENKNLDERLLDVGGNIVAKDWVGTQGNITLDFEVGLGSLGKTRKLRELTNSMAGPFCYVYA